MGVSAAKLFREVYKTELGRDLLAYLEVQGIDVVVEAPPSIGNLKGPDLLASYVSTDSKIYLSPLLTLPEMMHFFAHETRHVAQFKSDFAKGIRRSFNMVADPVNFRINMRLKEIDADVFAVYFLHNHAQETGSAHFAAMTTPPAESADRATRRFLYEAFDDIWERQGRANAPRALRACMLAAACVMIEEGHILRTYDRLSLGLWRKNVAPVLAEGAANKKHGDHTAFRSYLRAPLDRRALAANYAAVYAALFKDDGVPNYLSDINAENYVDHLDRRIKGDQRPLRRADARFQGICKTAASRR